MKEKQCDQDLIHFHTFLRNERIRKKITLEKLCKGLCSISTMARVESGERLPDKLLRDRFLGRLGVAREGYEDYLQPGEYGLWEQKQKIIYDFEHDMQEQAHDEIDSLLENAGNNRIYEQFCFLMKATLIRNEKGSIKKAAEYIECAKKLTMENVQFGELNQHFLSAQEIYILIRLLEFEMPDAESAYIELLNYVWGSFLDDIEKVKVYPLIVVQYERYLRHMNMRNLRTVLMSEACEHAMQLYRSTSRMYYLVEILELRSELLKQKIEMEGTKEQEDEELRNDLAQNDVWYQAVTGIYKRYNMESKMTSDLYLYKDTETYCISTVIHDRRVMLGYSIAELADGICSERTVRRIESGKVDAQMPIVLEIFERLGLSGEYTRAEVITNDYEAEMLVDKMAYAMKNCNYEYALQVLERLVKILPSNRINKQFCNCHRNNLLYRLQHLDQKEYEKNMLDVLAITVPINAILDNECLFLTVQEKICIYNIVNKTESQDKKKYIGILMKCLNVEKKYIEENHIIIFELIMSWIASNEGNEKNYGYSDLISNRITCKCLYMRRMNSIAENIFNNLWNFIEKNGNKTSIVWIIEELHCCIAFSQLCGNNSFEKFYNSRLKMINEGLYHL